MQRSMPSRRALLACLALCLAAGVACSSRSSGSAVHDDGGPPLMADGNPDLGALPSPDGSPLEVAASFNVTGTVTLKPRVGGGPDTPNLGGQHLLIRVDPQTPEMILAVPGSAVHVALQAGSAGTFSATGAFVLPLDAHAVSPCSSHMQLTDIALVATKDGLTGTAQGTVSLIMGDVGDSYGAVMQMTGTPDRTAPSLGTDVSGVDPLADVALIASEPLPATATATLTTGPETITLLPNISTESGVVTGFSRSTLALRYATTYQVGLSSWADLAGNAGAALPKLTTLPVPPLATPDGFETASGSLGGAQIVDASVLPPITGQRSAVVVQAGMVPGLGGADRMTVRLAVAAGATKVRFATRLFSQREFRFLGDPYSPFTIAVPGGAIVRPIGPVMAFATTRITLPSGASLWFGDVQDVELPLPAGTGDEIVFDVLVYGYPAGCGLLPALPPNVVIDDLRVE